jgi:hypothetical protein
MPNPTKVINTRMWLRCERGVVCTRCCAMSAALAPSSCNQGCGRCAHQPSERAHASSARLNSNHKPLETNKKSSGGSMPEVAALSSQDAGGKGGVVLGHGKPIYQVREPLQTCTPCSHTSRSLFPHPDFCYEMSTVCALMAACYLRESSECGSSGQIFIRAWACSS